MEPFNLTNKSIGNDPIQFSIFLNKLNSNTVVIVIIETNKISTTTNPMVA